ncbi:hypothetical protein [Chryseobacterium sp. ERMR1:04]|uniref:hypothetical protein n=1 Tax=Chryseobacterium sp. ERMR1:04 TaxID=1705393 RepID=UPI0006C8675C|nr:hypothetical protein [Chryseobacterium sp. ERMR1:04]KPH13753.1 hypothetical protein AMQ68_09430 [Chryseobacterium sp. ERMR1:04]
MEIKKCIYILIFLFSFLSCEKERKYLPITTKEVKGYQYISYKKRELVNDNKINVFEYNDRKITIEYDKSTLFGYGAEKFNIYQAFYDLDLGDLDLLRYDNVNTKSQIFLVELDDYSFRTYNIYIHQNNSLYYLGQNNIDLSKIIENIKNVNIKFEIIQTENNISIKSLLNGKYFSTSNYKLENPLRIYRDYSNINEYTKVNTNLKLSSESNKSNQVEYKNDIFSIDLNSNDEITVNLNNDNKKFVNTKILDGNMSCPDTSVDKIALKKNYFTIEKYNCNDKYYLKEYITFKFDNDLVLHRYDLEFTDKHDPDKSVPNKNYTSKDFGKVKFENVDREFLIKLLNR